MKLKTFFSILILLVVFASCRSSKTVVQNTEKTSSTYKEKTVSFKDTILNIEAVSSSLSVPLSDLIDPYSNIKKELDTVPLNTLNRSRTFSQKNGRSKITLKVDKGRLIATSDCDSIALRAQIRSEFIKELSKKESISASNTKIKTGYSLFTLVMYCFSCFCIGAVLTYILKTIKII